MCTIETPVFSIVTAIFRYISLYSHRTIPMPLPLFFEPPQKKSSGEKSSFCDARKIENTQIVSNTYTGHIPNVRTENLVGASYGKTLLGIFFFFNPFQNTHTHTQALREDLDRYCLSHYWSISFFAGHWSHSKRPYREPSGRLLRRELARYFFLLNLFNLFNLFKYPRMRARARERAHTHFFF